MHPGELERYGSSGWNNIEGVRILETKWLQLVQCLKHAGR